MIFINFKPDDFPVTKLKFTIRTLIQLQLTINLLIDFKRKKFALLLANDSLLEKMNLFPSPL